MKPQPMTVEEAHIEELKGQIARLQDALSAIERAVGFVPGTESLSTWVERRMKQLAEARAACGEMRDKVRELSHTDDFCRTLMQLPENQTLGEGIVDLQIRLNQAWQAIHRFTTEWDHLPTGSNGQLEIRKAFAYALSTDYGKDYVHRSELDKVSAAVLEMRELLAKTRNELTSCAQNWVLKEEAKLLVEALECAWRDILEWEQLATNHRKALGDRANFEPYCPSERAIAASESVRTKIGKALAHAKEMGL